MKKLFVLIAAIASFAMMNAGFAQTNQKWLTTYHPTWWYGVLKPSMIDFNSMTHIAIFPAQDALSTAPYFNASTIDDGSDYPQIVTLAHAKGVKVLISVVGGYGQTQMPIVAADPVKCQAFVNAACDFAKAKNADGIELDWEFPQASDDKGWNQMIRMFRKRLDTWTPTKGIMATSMFYSINGADAPPYHRDSMMVFDQINLMSYTMWMGSSAGPFKSGYDTPVNDPTSFANYPGWSLNHAGGGPQTFIEAGYPASKLGLGISFEGTRFDGVTTLGQAYTGWAFTSSVTTPLSTGYQAIPTSGRVWDPVAQANYCVSGNSVWSFQDTNSVKAISNWAKAQDWGGIMIYDIGTGYDKSAPVPDAMLKVAARITMGTATTTPTVTQPTGTFTTSATTVPAAGGTVTLTWTSQNASNASIDQGVGTVATSGSTTVSVTANKTYTLSLSNASGGSKQYSVSVSVTAAAQPTGTLTASATSLPAGGGNVTLTWTSANAASASIDQGVGAVATSGSTTVSVTSTKTYCLTLTSSTGAAVTYAVPVTVASAPSTGAPSIAIYNDTALLTPWTMDGTYSTTTDLANKEKIYKGTTAIKFVASAWAGISFRNGNWNGVTTLDPSKYDSLHLAIHGGSAGAAFALWLTNGSNTTVGSQIKFSVPANVWTLKSIPMSQFAAGTTQFAIVNLQLFQATAATFYIDDVSLVGKAATTPVVVIPSAPAVASPAAASIGNPTSLSLKWTKISNATLYHVQLSTVSTFASTVVNDSTLADTVRAASGLANSTAYYVRVRAKNSAGWSAYSVTSQFTTIAAIPAAPVPSSPANGATSQPLTVSLGWNASTGAASYGVQLASDSLFTSILANDTSVASTSKSVVVPGYLSSYFWRVYAKNTAGKSAWSPVQKFTTGGFVKPSARFTFISGTGNNATIAIPSTVTLAIAGKTLVAGDEIGVFTPAGLCVGAIEWNNANTALTVWGDNAQTSAIDGIRAGETMQFRVYRQSSNTVYTLVNATYQSGVGMYQPDALFTLTSLSTTSTPVVSTTQTIALAKGWNMIASSVKPNVTPIDSLTMQLASSMTIVKNGVGQVYWPSLAINSIGYWNYTQGYMVYMENAGTFAITGQPITPEATPIALQSGWNLAPYVRTSAMNVSTAAASLGSALTIVKNSAGQVYWPAYSINTIGSLTPGQSYQMFVSQASTLLYPANALAKTTESQSVSFQATTVHFKANPAWNGENQVLLVKTQGLADGDEIAVKTATNVTAGVGVVSNGTALVTVWADDQYTTNSVEGALANQSLSLVRWSKTDNAERSVSIARITDGLTGAEMATTLSFTSNGLAIVQTSIGTSEQTVTVTPKDFTLGQNYPNPFNPSTVIRYALPADAQVTLEVYSMLGTLVATLVHQPQAAGMHEVSFNAAGLSSGTYIYILKAGAFQAKNKMMLIK